VKRETQSCHALRFAFHEIDMPLNMPWAISIADLNSYLALAGVEPVQHDGLASG